MKTQFTAQDVEDIADRVCNVTDDLYPPAQIIVIAAALLATIRAVKQLSPVEVPDEVLAMERPLDEMLAYGLPAITRGERISLALKARMH